MLAPPRPATKPTAAPTSDENAELDLWALLAPGVAPLKKR